MMILADEEFESVSEQPYLTDYRLALAIDEVCACLKHGARNWLTLSFVTRLSEDLLGDALAELLAQGSLRVVNSQLRIYELVE